MKKYIVPILFSGLLFVPAVLFAVEPPGPPDIQPDIILILNRVVNWFFGIFLVIAVLFIIMAAFQFLTAGGDSTKISSARDKLLYAAMGIAVALLSRGIVPLVKMIIGVE